ncbi:MAG: GTP-binding protein [Candidatus Taylorbacteria bacterium]
MNPAFIRNFSIIAHIDHGKSTLADRLLEVTGTIEKRKMQEQVLDSMELERERGITIKLTPVRMKWRIANEDSSAPKQEYMLNLIDTPGHIDFSYEVSRALKAVEGSILLVDATQGVQAQTLTTLNMAREGGLVIVPVVSKIDSPLARTDEVVEELATLLGCKASDVIKVSGKTGEGVAHLLDEIIARVPSPESATDWQNELQKEERAKSHEVGGKNPSSNIVAPTSTAFRSLIFDFQYSNHIGVIVYVRVISGSVKRHDKLNFKVAGREFEAIDVGIFTPAETPVASLNAGEIGYIVTGIKEPGIASVGDTIASVKDTLPPLPGYMTPRPVVWASVYPESQDELAMLRQALSRLRLSDSSITYEEESSGTLGKGYRCGFLGMLHLEIVTERLRREFNLNLVVTMPTITYEVTLKNGEKKNVYSPSLFPDENEVVSVFEPIVTMKIILPPEYLNGIMKSLYDHEAEIIGTEHFGDNRTLLTMLMPLRELMRNFFDEIKSISSGYASISYDITESRVADVVRMDVIVNEEPVPAFARVVARRRAEQEAVTTVDRLYDIMPRELFSYKIQSVALGRIIASRTISGKRKDAAGTLSGGDITRKMKLREIQKKGRARLKEHGSVIIPQDVFVKMMRSGE